MSSPSIVKSAATSVFVFLGEKYLMGNQDLMAKLKYSAAIGASVYVSGLVSSSIVGTPDQPVSGQFYNVKTVQQRIVELSLGTAAGFIVNKFGVEPSYEFGNPSTMKRLGLLIGAEILGEYVNDYYTTQALSYLS